MYIQIVVSKVYCPIWYALHTCRPALLLLKRRPIWCCEWELCLLTRLHRSTLWKLQWNRWLLVTGLHCVNVYIYCMWSCRKTCKTYDDGILFTTVLLPIQSVWSVALLCITTYFQPHHREFLLSSLQLVLVTQVVDTVMNMEAAIATQDTLGSTVKY